ncbi:L-aspartate oxidase [Microbacterium sp. BLY]|uniref:L-aspartate oxidase n=1 Tax=Microbacterium sp. BLY TaxID=2823280 RepID=UPI001B33FB82|nr:L-aspartate oxidase [Microbacterium sp. BLY]MBP3977881.1 L-aspartate oxidase [Microbacterium sp. BLY]
MNVVVVGSGIAGLTAALHAHEAGHTVTVVTKGTLGDGCTPLAQGGVAGSYGPGDGPVAHAADTITAGAGLADPDAVDALVSDGAARIAELVARGVSFDHAEDGSLARGREAAHTHARILHAGGDATGAAIAAALCAALRRTSVLVREHAMLVDLRPHAGRVRGVALLTAEGPVELDADAVILATGGAGQLYAHTTNPEGATGDGIAAALRAGAAVADLEFVQFHPTVLPGIPVFLLSEAVRGEGAVLRDRDGRRFVFDSHPDGELAPRDVVARAIARQAAVQGTPVHLDATELGADTLARRFPTIDRVTRTRGHDWSREPLPVTPAAHYLMGGVITDLHGRTTLPGLFVVGEAARTGVHGANRLASNSLLEGAVFGARAAAALSEPWPPPHRTAPSAPGANPHPHDVSAPAFDRAALQRLLWDEGGLRRTGPGLQRALGIVRAWTVGTPPAHDVRTHEDRNLLLLADATLRAALARTVSVGAHHRDDPAPVPPIPAHPPILETA